MLGDLRARSGEPNGRVRFVALLVALGMVVASAPLVVVPVVRALWGLLGT